ncbi:MAG: hypothetical protein U9R74_17830 [Pseudomonadota bacterium]|nr:hypothetical protein [Pseudomonadota bacterium]
MLALSLPLPAQVHAQVVALDKSQSLDEKRTGWLPYIFATPSLGVAAGAIGFSAGFGQPQSSVFGTAFATSNKSALVSGGLFNYRLADSRFFLDSFLLLDHFTDQRFYADIDQTPTIPRAGSNNSNRDDFVSGVSNEATFYLNLKYRLPIGSLRDDPVAVYRLDEGLLGTGPAGGETWNPLTSGQTTVGTRFFYTYRDLYDFSFGPNEVNPTEELLVARTNGLEFWLEYNNTDFPRNPARGSRQLFKVTSDFGWLDSDNSWTNLEADLSKYYDLGTSGWFRQQVLALDFWTSSTPTWQTDPENDQIVTHRPPPKYGAELGGWDRLRAFPTGRFSDKSAVYYGAELRLTPRYRPFRDWSLLKYFQIDWWQVAPFVEAGRVGPDYNSDLFFKDLKWDVGIGIRLMAFRAVVRLDMAYGEEGPAAWAMIEQPFSRQSQ